MKAFALVYDGGPNQQNDLLRFVDSREEIYFWYVSLPLCILFTSLLNAVDLRKVFDVHFKGGKSFMVIEVPKTSDGRMTEKAWEIVNFPERFSKSPFGSNKGLGSPLR